MPSLLFFLSYFSIIWIKKKTTTNEYRVDASSAAVLDAMELAKAHGNVQVSSSPRIVVAASDASSFSSDCSDFLEGGDDDDDDDGGDEAAEEREVYDAGLDAGGDAEFCTDGEEEDEDEEVVLGRSEPREAEAGGGGKAKEEREEVVDDVLGVGGREGHGVVVKPRSMTLGTEETGSPPSRRVSNNSASAASVAVDEEEEEEDARRSIGCNADGHVGGEQEEQQQPVVVAAAAVMVAEDSLRAVAPCTPPPRSRCTTGEAMVAPVSSPEDYSAKFPAERIESPMDLCSPPRRKTGEAMKTPVPSPEEKSKKLSEGGGCPTGVSGGDEMVGACVGGEWSRVVAALPSAPSLNDEGEEQEEGDKVELALEVRVLVDIVLWFWFGVAGEIVGHRYVACQMVESVATRTVMLFLFLFRVCCVVDVCII